MTEDRTQRRRRSPWMPIVLLGVVIGGILLWYRGASEPQPRPRKVGGVRTHNIDDSRIAELELSLDGRSLVNGRHESQIGGTLNLTGTMTLQPDKIPKGAFQDLLLLTIHPTGTSEDVWSVRNSRRTWTFTPLHKDRVIENQVPVTEEKFPPGEYEMRLYLKILDMEGEQDSFDYLGNAMLSIVSK